MTKLKLGVIVDEKPIKLTIELPTLLHRDLLAYAEILASRRHAGNPRDGHSAMSLCNLGWVR